MLVIEPVIVLLCWSLCCCAGKKKIHNCPLVIVVLATVLTRLAALSTLLLVIDPACDSTIDAADTTDAVIGYILPTVVWLRRRIASHYRLLFLVIIPGKTCCRRCRCDNFLAVARWSSSISRTAVEKKNLTFFFQVVRSGESRLMS